MAKDSKQKQDEDKWIRAFLEKLAKLDDGERALLKRNAGNTLAQSKKAMFPFFLKVLPYGIPRQQEDLYFMLATLYPFDKLQRDKDRAAQDREKEEAENTAVTLAGNLGDSFRRARGKQEQNETGFNRQMARLLDADLEQLPFQLRQAIFRLTNDWVPIDWKQLTDDVLHWDRPSRYVQKEWARAYVAPQPSGKNPENQIS